MQKGTLAICDLDEAYTDSLLEHISEKQGLPFSTIAFTKKDALLKYMETHSIDLLLITDTNMDQNIALHDIGKILILSTGRILLEYAEYESIFKYQSAESILRELLNHYVEIHEKKGEISREGSTAEIIGVYSPIGRVGKTTFALTLGQILATDYKVLYINLEEFSAFDKILEHSYPGDLADLMYFFKQNPESLPIKLKAIVNSIHGMDYIPPLVYSGDLRNLDTGEWISMIQIIARTGGYQKIILDMSNMIKNVFEMLEICKYIYMPIRDDKLSLMKISAYEECLLRNENEKMIEKTIKIKLPKSGEQAWENNYLENQLWGVFGDFIRKIVKEAEVEWA